MAQQKQPTPDPSQQKQPTPPAQPPEQPVGDVAALQAQIEQLKSRNRVLEQKLASATAADADITPERATSFEESEGDRLDREQREHAEKVKADREAARGKASAGETSKEAKA
jgi:hypothetical protein